MSALRRRWLAGPVMVLLAGCSTNTNTNTNASSPSAPGGRATATVAGQSELVGSSVVAPTVPSLEDARAVALWWVAETGELLMMGPIARSVLIRDRVPSASSATMGESLQADLAKLAV